MAAFEWDIRYSTGNAIIDKQHEELFKVVKRLNEAFRCGCGHPEIGQMLEFLSNYAKEHFEVEEAFMARIAFPDQQAHRLEHRVMNQKVMELQNRYHFDDPTVGMAASQFLYKWLRHHILQKDFAYISYARETRQR